MDQTTLATSIAELTGSSPTRRQEHRERPRARKASAGTDPAEVVLSDSVERIGNDAPSEVTRWGMAHDCSAPPAMKILPLGVATRIDF